MRILIIEDDLQASTYLVKAFREAGHIADSAADGLTGYAMAESGGYDVLIVDRMLPKLDGLFYETTNGRTMLPVKLLKQLHLRLNRVQLQLVKLVQGQEKLRKMQRYLKKVPVKFIIVHKKNLKLP